MLPKMQMPEAVAKTVKWEKVTRGWYALHGITSVAWAKSFPHIKDDNRVAVVGFNGMLRDSFVMYTQPALDDMPQSAPELCQIVGVARGGLFYLLRIDPKTPEEASQQLKTLPVNCEPCAYDPGRRVLP